MVLCPPYPLMSETSVVLKLKHLNESVQPRVQGVKVKHILLSQQDLY